MPASLDSFVCFSQRHRCSGSLTARNQTPKRLKDKAVRKMANPGITTIHHAAVMYWRPEASMRSQDDSGGWIPKPRKLSADSVRMFRGTSNAAMVNRGVIRLGRMCLVMIRWSLEPMA